MSRSSPDSREQLAEKRKRQASLFFLLFLFSAITEKTTFGFMKLVPPKGGTLTAAGIASPAAWDNPAPPEYRVYAEHKQTTEWCPCFV